ncbi:MAG: hypothetical protein GT599_11130 [Bacteroidales bacterium]|jgi:hypothetical protein|nr:hypothetical protein [Bacteroidales bacterium]
MTGTIIKIATVILLMSFCSCRNSSVRQGGLTFPVADSVPAAEAEKLSEEAVADIVQNIASPVEIAAILQSMQIPFSAGYLASTQEADRLTTNFRKAVMLGIYGADLGYLNIYGKTGNSVDVLSAIKRLADGLRVGQFFDFETLKRLSTSKSNLDSLLFLSVNSYNQIDNYLRNNDRGSISALMITGVWIEGQYLATQVALSHDDEILRDRIGEQKIILGDLLMLLRPYRGSSEEYGSLYDMMEQIRAKYAGVKVSYKLAEPETREDKDGRLVMVQNEESIVEMTDDQLAEIAALSKEVRNKLISGN